MHSSRNPFEVAAFFICGLLGLFYWLNAIFAIHTNPPNSVETLLPPIVLYVWYALLLLGGLVGLFGIFMPNRVNGLFIERGALISIGCACFMYSIALFFVSGLGALGSGAFLCALGLACVVRFLAIPAELRQVTLVSQVISQIENDQGEEVKK